MSKILVFGGRSFLGGHICRTLVDRGHRVILHSTTSTEFENLQDFLPHPFVETVSCDYLDKDRLKKLMNQCRFFIHAAIPYSMQSIGRSKENLLQKKQLEAVLSTLASSKIEKSVFVSVCGTIGAVTEGTADETLHLKTPKGWGHLKNKLISEQMILDFSKKGINAVIVNPTVFIGEYDYKPSTGEFFRFLSKFPFGILRDRKMSIVDVKDVAEGTVLALEKGVPGERYILSAANTTIGEFMRRIKALDGKPMPRLSIPRWAAYFSAYTSEVVNLIARRNKPLIPLMGLDLIEHGSQHLSYEKAKKELGFKPGDAWSAVDRSYHWYKDNGLL